MSKNNHYDPEPITSIIKACGDAGVIEFSLGDLHISFGKAQSVSRQPDIQPAELTESPQENYDSPTWPAPQSPSVEAPYKIEQDLELQSELELSELAMTDPYAYEMKQLEEATHGDAIQ